MDLDALFRDAVLSAIEAQGLTIAEAARRSGVRYDVIRDMKRGKSASTSAERAQRIAEGLGFEWPPTQAPRGGIAVAGDVGAGAEVDLVDAYPKGNGKFMIECPPQLTPHGVVAVQVKGDSMEPAFSEGDILFYSRVSADGVPSEAIGRKVIAETTDGRIWVKQLKIGTEPGLFHLLSLNPIGRNILNAEVRWAAPVRLHLPREFVTEVPSSE